MTAERGPAMSQNRDAGKQEATTVSRCHLAHSEYSRYYKQHPNFKANEKKDDFTRCHSQPITSGLVTTAAKDAAPWAPGTRSSLTPLHLSKSRLRDTPLRTPHSSRRHPSWSRHLSQAHLTCLSACYLPLPTRRQLHAHRAHTWCGMNPRCHRPTAHALHTQHKSPSRQEPHPGLSATAMAEQNARVACLLRLFLL